MVGERRERFRELSIADRRTVLLHLSARYTLTERKLALELSPLLFPVQENARAFEAEMEAFERGVYISESSKKAAFDRLSSIWGPLWNAIRTVAVRERSSFARLELSVPETA